MNRPTMPTTSMVIPRLGSSRFGFGQPFDRPLKDSGSKPIGLIPNHDSLYLYLTDKKLPLKNQIWVTLCIIKPHSHLCVPIAWGLRFYADEAHLYDPLLGSRASTILRFLNHARFEPLSSRSPFHHSTTPFILTPSCWSRIQWKLVQSLRCGVF